jgi:OmpA-OmpF porin, OOP family
LIFDRGTLAIKDASALSNHHHLGGSMMRRSATAAAALAAVLFSVPAAAQMSMNNAYAGLEIGQAKVKDACGDATSCDDKDTVWRVFAGYQLNRNFAIEGGYADLGRATASGVIGGVDVSARFETTAWDLVAVGILPLANRFSLYGKLGLYYGTVKATATGTLGGFSQTDSEKDSGTDLTFGIGALFDITRNIGVRAEYRKYSDVGGSDVGESDVDVIGISVLYRFQ